MRTLRKCTPVLLLVVAGVFFCISRGQSRTNVPVDSAFAFWYEPWQTGTTINKLQAANIIIGVPPTALSEIHKAGKRGLQYVTYYQSGFKTAFLKDGDDLSNVGFNAGTGFEKSAFGGKDNYVLCPNSVELKARALRYLDGSLKEGFDGYFIDNSYLDPSAHESCAAAHPHIKPGVQGGRAYIDLLAAVRDKMKQQNPSAILVSNPGSASWADRIAAGQPSLWDVSDYVVWESYGYTSHSGPTHDRWKQTIEQSFIYAAAPDRARKILTLSYPQNTAEARFAFAVARIFGFRSSANLGEKQQGKNEEGGHFGVFANDIPMDLGEPLGPLPERTGPLLHRAFSNGEVFVNSSTVPEYVLTHRNGIVYLLGMPPERVTSLRVELRPMSAAVVLNTH